MHGNWKRRENVQNYVSLVSLENAYITDLKD